MLKENSGVVWKVSPGKSKRPFPGGISALYALLAVVALAAAPVIVGAGRARVRRPVHGLLAGAVGGLVMGVFTMVVAAPALHLPWHAPRVLATMVIGRSAVANILEFDLVPFVVGVLVAVVLTVALGALFAFLVRAEAPPRGLLAGILFALTDRAALHHFFVPAVFPLVTEKGFTPDRYALSFAVYGAGMGALVAIPPLGARAARPARTEARREPAPTVAAGPEETQEERLERWRRERGGHQG